MAKKKESSNGSTVLGSGVRPTVPATPTGAAPEVAPAAGGTAAGRTDAGWTDAVGGAVASSVQVVRNVLPPSRLPVYLAATALLVAGLIDPPVALGAGLAYEALRRWEPRAAR
jgi:hypothetical protein